MRTATFIIGDPRGVTPANVDQGYVLRRLIRRRGALRHAAGAPDGFTAEVAQVIIDQYGDVYPELRENAAHIREQLVLEEQRFARTLRQGEREFEKILQSHPEVQPAAPHRQQARLQALRHLWLPD